MRREIRRHFRSREEVVGEPASLLAAEQLTLAVLMCGVAALALSDFVSPFYWSVVTLLAVVRFLRGGRFALSELQASLIGWAGFLGVGVELLIGRAFLVAFTDFLLVLALAVIVEAPTPRNHLHRLMVGLFLILAASVLTDSVLYAIPLTLFLLLLWRAAHKLYGMQQPGGDLPAGDWRHDWKLLGGMLAAALILFVLLPRFDFHSWLKPTQPRMATNGFTDTVQLGDFARELDTTVVLRIEPVGGDAKAFRTELLGRYWRGIALSRYNGHGWSAGNSHDLWRLGGGRPIELIPGAQTQQVALYREATDHPLLLLPQGTLRIAALAETVAADDRGALRFTRSPARRLRLLLTLGDRSAELPWLAPPDPFETSRDGITPTIAAWAQATVGDALAPREQMGRLVGRLLDWEYDLNAPINAEQPIEHFLTTTHRGHCELYASALALAARSLGIPSRVVNGYYGGEWNEMGGFYLIRQQHAHSWVEAWIDGSWQRFDATPPARWELSGVRLAALDQFWESVKLAWYRYILEFQSSDRALLWQQLLALFDLLLRWAIPLTALVGGLLLLRRFARLPRFGHAALLPRIDRWLRRRGVERQPWQPLAQLPPPEGIDATAWRRFVDEWEAQRFGVAAPWSLRTLRQRLRALVPSR